MPYLNETGLAYYDPKLKEWISSQPVKTIPSSLYPWTQTEKAGAVTCYPVGETPLLPTVDFIFSETGPAEGTKGPDNPSTITGVSAVEVTRCGANLFKYPYYRNTDGQNSAGTLKWEPKTDGTVRLIINNVTANSFYYMYQFTSNIVNSDGYSSLQTGKYRVSLKLISGTLSSDAGLYLSHYSGFFGETATIVNTVCDSEEEFTVSDYSQKHLFIFKVMPGFSADVVVRPVLTLLADADDAIEQYTGTDYTISLNGTYYGGSLDLATGVMTVTRHGYVFDGTENWGIDGNGIVGDFYQYFVRHTAQNYGNTDYSQESCTHFPVSSTNLNAYPAARGTKSFVYIMCEYATASTFKQWLASQYSNGTPVVFVYGLETPYTVQLTPQQILSLSQTDKYTPRLNTVYTDALAVQVGYVKSPIREEYELTQAIVAQGGNI